MEEDMSNVLNKFQDILKEKNIDLNDFLGSSSSTNNSENNTNSSNSNLNFDIDSVLKIKKILNTINNTNNPRNNLLYSLKPFLRDEKKEKLEQYIKISNLLSVIELLNNDKKDLD